jgi:PAS domain S-box-containing protein
MLEPKRFSSFDYLNALLKNAKQNAVLLVQTDGTISAINTAFTKNFGYQETDLIGQNLEILFTGEEHKKGLPKKELGQVQATGQADDKNYLVNKNKETTWVSGESVLVKNEKGEAIILKILQNIHQQKTNEISIRELNNFNENILATINDAVIVLDPQLHVIKVNSSFLKLTGKEHSEIAGLDFTEFIKQFDADHTLYKSLQEVITSENGFSNKQIDIEIPDGNKRTFEVTCTPLLNLGQRHLLLVIHDITITKELEKEREDIIGFVTHELRNPLSTLSLSNEIMKEAAKENNISLINKILERFENNLERMNKMVAGLYESTKANSGNFLLEISEFNFGEMVKEAISTIAILQPSFHIITIGNGDFKVVADRYRLIQVVVNYLSNAIKYSNGNKEVVLSINRDNHSVTVCVKDHGMGISKEHLPYVFERFFRINKIRNIEGIGLGLYLCKQIIRSHKGQVWVESEENNGSAFYFSIPLTAE